MALSAPHDLWFVCNFTKHMHYSPRILEDKTKTKKNKNKNKKLYEWKLTLKMTDSIQE